MSLVNDALKRAKDAHDKQTAPPLRGAPLHTFEPAPARNNSRGIWLVLLLLIGASAGIWYWNTSHTYTATVVVPTIAVHPATPPTPTPTAVTTDPKVEPTPPPVADESRVTIPPPMPPPAPPVALKLQGILYSATKPSAILNGRTVFVGDVIGDATVSAIAPDRVTVIYNKQPFVIRMP